MRLIPMPVALAIAAMPSCIYASDLLDAYNHARSNDPTLSRFNSLRRSASEGIALARAPLLPSISAKISLSEQASHGSVMTQGWQTSDGSSGETNNQRTTDVTRKRSASITASQSILSLANSADLRAARLSSYAQNAAYDAALQQLAGRVATTYFRVLMNDDALSFAKENERVVVHQLERAEQRSYVGLSAVSDVQNARARRSTAKASVIDAEKELSDSREALTQITGQPTEVLKKLRAQLPLDLPSLSGLESWVSRAAEQSPIVLALQYEVESAEQRISSARARHLPTIDATVAYRKTGIWPRNENAVAAANGRGDKGRGTITVGIVLKIPIFGRNTAQSSVRQAIHQRDAAQDELEGTRRQVAREIRNRYRSVIGGISKIESTKSAAESSDGALDATQAGLEIGTRTLADVLAAELNLSAALGNYSRARHQFILDKLLLKQAAGTVELNDLKAINSLLQ